MTIKTSHRGYEVTYAENEDVWRCWELELDHATLSGLRRKIDVIDRKRRAMAEPVAAFRLDEHREIVKVGVSLIADPPNPQRTWEAAGKAWILTDPTGKDRKGREKMPIDRLVPVTPEAEAAITTFLAARDREEEAKQAARAAFSAIPRFTYDALKTLLPAGETEA